MGYEIIIGNNPLLPYAKKWSGYECVRLCGTNSRYHGWSIRTVFAVRRVYVFELERVGDRVIEDWEEWAYDLLYEVDGDNIQRFDGYIVTTNKDVAEDYEMQPYIEAIDDGNDFCKLVLVTDVRITWYDQRFGRQAMFIERTS